MQDLAMISLELLQNSLNAQAKHLDFHLTLHQADGSSTLTISDDGCGMDESTLKKVSSPFFTSRSTRKVGLGVAFFKQAIEQAGGSWDITSVINQGTTITGTWQANHWDAPPIGNIGEVIMICLQGHPDVHLSFNFRFRSSAYTFDSKAFETSIAPVPLSDFAILNWIESEINMSIQHCKGGIDYEES